VTPELLDFAGENIGSMPRRRWLPWLLGWMAILVVLAWALLGGVFAVVMVVIFPSGTILGLIPLKPRRQRGRRR
jgi:fatty acid desaturase